MKKIIISIFILIYIIGLNGKVHADWWSRDAVRPTQPSIPRETIPTTVPPTTVPPTSSPASPTVTPRAGGPSIAPQPTSASGGSTGSSEDPCGSGKSFTGAFCGWSPGVGGNTSGGGGSSTPRIGGLPVRGLSYTSSRDLASSDIILLAGVLCLLLYVRSKLKTEKSI